MSARRLLLFVILLAACGGITFFGYSYGSTVVNENAVEDAGNQYMQAIQAGDYATAYSIIDPTFQSQMSNPEGLQNFQESWGFFPASWNFHERNVEGGVGTVEGSVRMSDGRNMGVLLTMAQVEGTWRITQMDFLTS